MSNVLIVSKTKMANGTCIGGIVIPSNDSVRLLDENGNYQPTNTVYNIGQLWEITLKKATNIIPPHYEDVLVISKKLKATYKDLRYAIDNCTSEGNLWKGHPTTLFQGLIQWTNNRRVFISERIGIPSVSTGFWIPDSDLMLINDIYSYNDGNYNYEFKYVGTGTHINPIPAETLIRVSLAKWWRPPDVEMEKRCYLQLSGWYL